MKKLIFAVAIACIGARFAHAEQNQNWFTGYAEGTEAKATNGAWPQTMPAGVTVADGKFTLTDEAPLDFTPTASKAPDTNVMTRVVAVAKFPANNKSLLAPAEEAKTALSVLNSFYYAYANDAWVELEGTPDAENAVTVLVEVDYKQPNAPRARYGIITDAGATTNFLNVAGTSDAWLTLAGDSPDLISKVSFDGEGEVTSVRGDVQLGVALYDSVKYPTVQGAVDAAGATPDAKVTVLRDNNDSVVISAGQKIELDTNGKSSGALVNNSDTPVKVDVPAEDVSKGNGLVEIKTTVDGKYTVETSDESKMIAGTEIIEGKTYAIVTTRDEIITGLKVADKTLSIGTIGNSTLRTYLQANSTAYSGPSSTTDGIQAQLNATGENGMTVGQSYALGLDPEDEIILQPAGADADPENVKLAMPNVKPNSDFTVTYQVQKHNGTTWEDYGSEQATPQIPVGSGRFRVNTIIAPAN